MSRRRNRKYRCIRHFKYRIKRRFHLDNTMIVQLEKILMRRLFLGKLKIVEEDERALRIWFPELHKKCILIFDKKDNIFITGYVGNKSFFNKHNYLKV